MVQSYLNYNVLLIYFAAVNCAPLPKITDGIIEPATCTEDEVMSGTNCHVGCKKGYKLQGQKEVTCTTNAVWDPGDTAGSICIGEKHFHSSKLHGSKHLVQLYAQVSIGNPHLLLPFVYYLINITRAKSCSKYLFIGIDRVAISTVKKPFFAVKYLAFLVY